MWGCSYSYHTARVRVVSCPSSVLWLFCICDFFVVVGMFFSESGGSHAIFVQCPPGGGFGDPMIWLVHEVAEPVPGMLAFGGQCRASRLAAWLYSKVGYCGCAKSLKYNV